MEDMRTSHFAIHFILLAHSMEGKEIIGIADKFFE
jgi:hypothetical protein